MHEDLCIGLLSRIQQVCRGTASVPCISSSSSVSWPLVRAIMIARFLSSIANAPPTQLNITIPPSTLHLKQTFRKEEMPPPAAFVPREPDGIGVGKPAHPFAATVEAQVPVSPFSSYLSYSDERTQSSQMDMGSNIMRITLSLKVFCTSS